MKREVYTKSNKTVERLKFDSRYELKAEIYDDRRRLIGALFLCAETELNNDA